MTRYSVGFLLAIGLIIVVIVLIIRGFMTGGPKAPKAVDLNSYSSSNVSVQLKIEGPVVAPAKHHDVVITVSNTDATLKVTKGYQGETMRLQSYPMDVSAYAVFLHALTVNGFTKGDTNSKLSDERGECALGQRYVYQILDGEQNDMERFWSTSCGTGTFKGNAATIRRLFIAQIPDYSKLTSGIGF